MSCPIRGASTAVDGRTQEVFWKESSVPPRGLDGIERVDEANEGRTTIARRVDNDKETKEQGRSDATVIFGQRGLRPGAPRGWTSPPNLRRRVVNIHIHQENHHQRERHPPIGLVKVMTYGCSLGVPLLFTPHPHPSRTRPRSLSLTRT